MKRVDKNRQGKESTPPDSSKAAVPSSDYRVLFESVPDPCLVLDPELRIVAVNMAYLAATMTEHEEIIDRGIFDVFPDNPEDQNATGVRNLSASLNRVLKNRVTDVMSVQKYDIRKPEAEGGGFEERYWSPINTPVFGIDNEIAYIIHRVQDVTEFVHLKQKRIEVETLAEELRTRVVQMEAESFAKSQEVAQINLKLKRANVELKMQNEKLLELNSRLEMEAAARSRVQDALNEVNADLERSNKELEMFASVTSHDLQEPLHTITSYTELFEHKYKGKLDQQADTYIHYIVDGTTHMHMMVNDLLAYSRVGTRAKPFGQVNMDSVLDQALDSLRKSIAESNATINRMELPELEGDDVQLTQLFQNLIGNAIKFRKKDAPLHIRVSAEHKGNEWIFGVHDNGIGIEARFFDRIFEIFRRLHTRGEFEGSGIGLAICRKIVEHHGGRIWVESTFGEGSSFHFTMPVRGENHGA